LRCDDLGLRGQPRRGHLERGGLRRARGGKHAPELLANEIAKTREKTKNPFGVNLITVAPAFKDHIDVVIREKCPFVFFAGSIPSGRTSRR